jgi:uncharacterized protein
VIGTLMLIEAVNTLRALPTRTGSARRAGQHTWIQGLPLKMRFPQSKLYISTLPPVAIGAFVGWLTAIMGVGGGFVMVPAMIYVLGMPTSIVVGTSQFQIIFVSANVTILQSIGNQTVDIALATALMVGSIVAAPFGSRLGTRLRGDQIRILLALMVLAVAVQLGINLVVRPTDLYSAVIPTGAVPTEPPQP